MFVGAIRRQNDARHSALDSEFLTLDLLCELRSWDRRGVEKGLKPSG
jgi:hypothetical protein